MARMEVSQPGRNLGKLGGRKINEYAFIIVDGDLNVLELLRTRWVLVVRTVRPQELMPVTSKGDVPLLFSPR